MVVPVPVVGLAAPGARAVKAGLRAQMAAVPMAAAAVTPVRVEMAVMAAAVMPPTPMVRPVVLAVILVQRVMLVAREQWAPGATVAATASAAVRVVLPQPVVTAVMAARAITLPPT